MIGNGRQKIYTDAKEVNETNIIDVLRDVVIDHTAVASECTQLINFVAGLQPLQREKTYRSDINIVDIDNVADEITNFKTSFNWGNPITLVQRGENDGGSKNESEAIAHLNFCFDAEKNREKTQELASFVEKCGIGYTYIDVNTDYEDGDSFFKYVVLDPRNAFKVYSNAYSDHRAIMDVTFRTDKVGNKYYTVFTKDRRYEVVNLYSSRKGLKEKWTFGEGTNELNPLGKLPLVEWIRCTDRTGCFERQIDAMNTLNILESDFANDVDQNTQCVWHANDIDFPTTVETDEEGNEVEVTVRPKSNDWLETTTTPEGKTPFLNAVTVPYDYTGMLNNYLSKRALILQKCNVPSRNDNSGGSTGVAMSDATGWTQAEVEATQQDQLKSDFKLDEVKLALIASKLCVGYNGEFKDLKYSDVKPNIKRQKTYELNNKLNAIAVGISHGIDYKSLLNNIPVFDDPQQVIRDSEKTIKMYLEKTFGTNNTPNNDSENNGQGIDKRVPERLEQDSSDQNGNSPTLDKGRG